MQQTGRRKFAAWKLLALGALAVASGGAVVAQNAVHFEPRAHVAMMVTQMRRQWNLSDVQMAKIKVILQEAIPRGVAIHDNMKLAPETRRAQLNQLHATTRARIDALLTPPQREKAAHWQRDARAGVQQTLVRIAADLKLSDDQQKRLRPIVADGLAQAESLRGDMSLTVAQKFMRLQQIRKTTRARVGRVLTPSQNAELDRITDGMLSEARHQFAMWREINPR